MTLERQIEEPREQRPVGKQIAKTKGPRPSEKDIEKRRGYQDDRLCWKHRETDIEEQLFQAGFVHR
jgi:hypothetical protein